MYYHTISDAHIYSDQVEQARTMVEREPLRLPTVHLNDTGRQVGDIHDFRAEHFDLTDYHPHPGLRVPVAP
jgi:thymidylate synthase